MASKFLCHTELWEESQEDFLKGKGHARGHPASAAFENQPKAQKTLMEEMELKDILW